MAPPIEPAIIINCVLSPLFNWLGTTLGLGLELGLGVSEEEENGYASELELTNFRDDEQSNGSWLDEKDIFSVALVRNTSSVNIELVTLGVSRDDDIFSVALVVVDCWVVRCWDEEDLLSVELSCTSSVVVGLLQCWEEKEELGETEKEDCIPSAHFVVDTVMTPWHLGNPVS